MFLGVSDQSKQQTWNAVQGLLREYDDPNEIIARCEREAGDRERRAEALQSEALAFRQMIDAVGSLSGIRVTPAPTRPAGGPAAPVRPVSTPERPVGTEAVRRVMRDGGVWTIQRLFEELKHRNWDSKTAQDPLKATEAAVSRLVSVKKEVERVGRGEYRYIGIPSSPDSAEELSSFAAPNHGGIGPSPLLALSEFRERQT
jgi:hypothetical protein